VLLVWLEVVEKKLLKQLVQDWVDGRLSFHGIDTLPNGLVSQEEGLRTLTDKRIFFNLDDPDARRMELTS
jgi:hypothetical protein